MAGYHVEEIVGFTGHVITVGALSDVNGTLNSYLEMGIITCEAIESTFIDLFIQGQKSYAPTGYSFDIGAIEFEGSNEPSGSVTEHLINLEINGGTYGFWRITEDEDGVITSVVDETTYTGTYTFGGVGGIVELIIRNASIFIKGNISRVIVDDKAQFICEFYPLCSYYCPLPPGPGTLTVTNPFAFLPPVPEEGEETPPYFYPLISEREPTPMANYTFTMVPLMPRKG